MLEELSGKEISATFVKLKKTPKLESFITENSNNVENGIKTMILDRIDKLWGKKRDPDIDSIFDFLSNTVATNIGKDPLTNSISQLITEKVLVNKKTPNGSDSLINGYI